MLSNKKRCTPVLLEVGSMLGDPTWGERVCTMVIAALGENASAQELRSHCRRCLAGYKTPKCKLLADALPVNAAGKVDKAAIRALISAKKTS